MYTYSTYKTTRTTVPSANLTFPSSQSSCAPSSPPDDGHLFFTNYSNKTSVYTTICIHSPAYSPARGSLHNHPRQEHFEGRLPLLFRQDHSLIGRGRSEPSTCLLQDSGNANGKLVVFRKRYSGTVYVICAL